MISIFYFQKFKSVFRRVVHSPLSIERTIATVCVVSGSETGPILPSSLCTRWAQAREPYLHQCARGPDERRGRAGAAGPRQSELLFRHHHLKNDDFAVTRPLRCDGLRWHPKHDAVQVCTCPPKSETKRLCVAVAALTRALPCFSSAVPVSAKAVARVCSEEAKSLHPNCTAPDSAGQRKDPFSLDGRSCGCSRVSRTRFTTCAAHAVDRKSLNVPS